MASTPRDKGASDAEEPVNEFPPTPDEGGPHDVPDDEVIEQTLPAASTKQEEKSGTRQPPAGSDRPSRR
jgi:hypothetical protein